MEGDEEEAELAGIRKSVDGTEGQEDASGVHAQLPVDEEVWGVHGCHEGVVYILSV